jgi:hypothetical protein
MRAAVAATCAALALGACGAGERAQAPAAPTTTPALASAACPRIEQPPIQTGSHLIGDAEPPIPYSSVPPSSGWHATSVPTAGIHADGLSDPQIVSLLEAGVVVVAYHPDAAPDPDLTRRLVDQFPQILAFTTYPAAMPTPVALVTWGRIARCSEIDPTAITEFVVEDRVAPAEAHGVS